MCRVCGQEARAGGIIRLGQTNLSDENEADRAARLARLHAFEVKRWHSNRMALSGVRFPVYAAQGWPARMHGSGSTDDRVTSVAIAHTRSLSEAPIVERPPVVVTTSIDTSQPGELTIARRAFRSGIEPDADRQAIDGLSDGAIALRFRANRRRRTAAAYAAPAGESELTIDGALEPFSTVGPPDGDWVAVRRHHDVTITIAARGVDPASIVLEPIADPAAPLLGPEPDAP